MISALSTSYTKILQILNTSYKTAPCLLYASAVAKIMKSMFTVGPKTLNIFCYKNEEEMPAEVIQDIQVKA